jgi:hypothetical protein
VLLKLYCSMLIKMTALVQIHEKINYNMKEQFLAYFRGIFTKNMERYCLMCRFK